MNIMAISDQESSALWDHYDANRLTDIDLILSCGDLDPHYLSFLVTFSNVPVLYVHGNHDDCYDTTEPEGCICIDDKIYVYEGIRILGLGGSIRYRDGKYMYTEQDMKRRIRRLALQLRRHRGFDILLTHSPAHEIGDWDSPAHRGFKCFVNLLEQYAPKYMVHGHVHLNYGTSIQRTQQYQNTKIINAYERYTWTY